MMTETEMLLIKLIEEASEVQKAATKWLRFGRNSYNVNDFKKTTNSKNLKNELADLTAVRSLLSECTKEDFSTDMLEDVTRHIAKTKKSMSRSVKLGRLIKRKDD